MGNFDKNKFDETGFKIIEISRDVVEKISGGKDKVVLSAPKNYEILDANDKPVSCGLFVDFDDAVQAVLSDKFRKNHAALLSNESVFSGGKKIVRREERFVVPNSSGAREENKQRPKIKRNYLVYYKSELIFPGPVDRIGPASKAIGLSLKNRERAKKIGLNFLVWMLTGIAFYLIHFVLNGLSNSGAAKKYAHFSDFLDWILVSAHAVGFLVGWLVIILLIWLGGALSEDNPTLKESVRTIKMFLRAWGEVVINFGSISLVCVVVLFCGFQWAEGFKYLLFSLVLYFFGVTAFYKK